jgi:hypothetical protein
LACGTKSTAYLFFPPDLLGVWQGVVTEKLWRVRFRVALAGVGSVGVGVLLLNAPKYSRNLELSGLILGSDFSTGRWFLPLAE